MTTKQRFTPGEWKVREYDPAYPNESFVDIPNGYIEIGGSSSRRGANAALIAAAPSLHAALETLLRRYDFQEDDQTIAEQALRLANGEA